MKTIFILLAIITFSLNNLFSQDTIYTKNNEKIICKIKEISTDEIKYQLTNSDILIGVDENDVKKINLSNGTVMKFEYSMFDKARYKDQKKNALKFRILSPLYGYSDFTYERSIKPGQSFEASLGIIGLGVQPGNGFTGFAYAGYQNYDYKGVSLRIGYKFISTPNFYLKGIRYAHLLKGFYFRPELAFSTYNYQSPPYGYSNNSPTYNSVNITAFAILWNIGYQFIFNDIIALDMYFGIGFGQASNQQFGIQYGYSTGGKTPIAVSSGIRIGFLFPPKSKEKSK